MFVILRVCKIPHRQGNRYFRAMSDTLVLLHVIFRHGDRTQELEGLYPKDPYKDYDYSPYGYGDLTKMGKRRAYRLGQSLRERYGHFLDDSYKPEHLNAWVSDYDRTKMTLQLVLASLYPPKNEQIWNDEIPWQPIPYHCTPRKDDKMFLAFECNNRALTEYNNYVNGPGQDVLQAYRDSIDYIEHHTGKKISVPRVAFDLSGALIIYEKMGLKLPEWTKEVWPHRLGEIAMQEFEFIMATPRMKSLIVGKLLQKIVEDSISKIKGQSQYKVHLYSGHDYTICMFLRVLDLLDGRHPDFCSNVAVELHKIDGVFGFMIKYQCNESEDPKLLEIPNVGSFWPIEDFVEQYVDILDDRPYDLIDK